MINAQFSKAQGIILTLLFYGDSLYIILSYYHISHDPSLH